MTISSVSNDGMHALICTHYGINWAGNDAQGAANTVNFIYDSNLEGPFLAAV
jgi:hypothetical protein